MAITKLLLLLVVSVAEHYGTTSPNVRPPADQLREQHGVERLTHLCIFAVQLLLWTWALLEASVFVALSGYCPSTLASLFLHLPHTTALTTPSPSYVAGTLLAATSAALRVVCYRALGPRFTFELSIRPGHTLATNGVYGVVRHPSYVGLFGLAIGWLLCALDPRGVAVAVLVASTGGLGGGHAGAGVSAVLACAWTTALGVLWAGMSRRIDREDAMLEEAFGDVWRAWANEVPYRLVPGVY